LFYLLGYTREEICERGTNAFNLKKAKSLINEKLFFKLSSYNPVGPRNESYKVYQQIAFLKKNLEGITDEAVEEYSIVIAKIFKWLNMAIDLRCEDVVNRRDTIEYAKQDRNAALAAEAARTAKFEHAHNEAKTAFDEKVDAEMAKEAAE